ncbi:hypothetical protein NKH18_42170 [Streptomyces sp. M10(2022)]
MGSLMERWGLPQATGRLFGYLLLRNKPVDLDTMTRELGQAKSGLSVAARQLESWTLVRRSTRPGSRRIDYEAVGDLQHLLLVNNAHMRKLTETLRAGIPVARAGPGPVGFTRHPVQRARRADRRTRGRLGVPARRLLTPPRPSAQCRLAPGRFPSDGVTVNMSGPAPSDAASPTAVSGTLHAPVRHRCPVSACRSWTPARWCTTTRAGGCTWPGSARTRPSTSMSSPVPSAGTSERARRVPRRAGRALAGRDRRPPAARPAGVRPERPSRRPGAAGVTGEFAMGSPERLPDGRTVNDWLLEATRDVRDRVQVWAGLSLRDPAEALRELERALAAGPRGCA